MSISKAALKLVLRQPVLLIVHLGLLGLIGVVLVQGLAKGTASSEVTAMKPTVAVVDRDNSELSRALASYIESRGRAVDIGTTRRDLQDATATARVAYLAIIPAGYQADFIAAAAATGSGLDGEAQAAVDGPTGAGQTGPGHPRPGQAGATEDTG
ncbi:MAG: ABC transporter permease, partial [Bifidobacteriaceae bacterium]|nr:ABC transporter permease [Bifidobacteriaceae bacterium]